MANVYKIRNRIQEINILVLGDIHGYIPRITKRKIEEKKVELILCTGDYLSIAPVLRNFQLKNYKKIKKLMLEKKITWQKAMEKLIGKKKFKDLSRNNKKNWFNAIKKITSFNRPVISVFGNMDNYNLLRNRTKNMNNFKLINGKTINYKCYRVIGIGDYIRPSIKNIKEKINKFENKIEELLKRRINKKTIILSHYPPYGFLDKVKGKHTGLKFLAYLIKKYDPLLFICGHIHEGKGITKFNKTYVINAGTVKKGYFLIKIKQDTNRILFDHLK